MPVQSQFPLSHSNQYSADSACEHCDGVIRHEPWCIMRIPAEADQHSWMKPITIPV